MNAGRDTPRAMILLIWMFYSTFSAGVSIGMAGVYREYACDWPIDSIWRPFNHFDAYYFSMPLEWVIFILSPLGWISLGSLISAIYEKKKEYLVASYLSAFVGGFFWPMLLENMASI